MTLPIMQIGTDNDGSVTTAAPPAILGTYKRPPVEMVRGNGVYLYDETGKAYLDFASGTAVNASEKLWIVSASRATEPLTR